MSHFSVAVFSRTPGDVEALLAPFDEQVEAGSPYAEFVRNEEYDWDKTVGAKGYWRNPNARWDWWEIGGRWRGLLRLRPGKSGYTATLDRWHSDFVYPPHCCDAALVADCDFSPQEAQIRQAARLWEVAVEGDAPREGEEFFSPWKPEYYLERYGDKETFIRRESAFSTYAFITAEGKWHGQGRMGWFALDDATNESIASYEEAFQAYLEKARREGLAITIVDCHI